MNKKRLGAIFDLDGTLLDSMGVWRQIDVDFLGKRGLAVPADYLEAITPMGFPAAADYTIRRFGFSETPEEIMREWHGMALDAYANRVELKDGAAEYLRRLRAQGTALAVATSSERELFLPALLRNGVAELFDAFVTVREVRRGKGFPDIYERAAERIGCEPGCCVVFEDILEGIRGAKLGGFFAAAVADAQNLHGEAVMRREADAYVADFRELLEEPGKDPLAILRKRML